MKLSSRLVRTKDGAARLLKCLPTVASVEGVNLAKKHIKPNPNIGEMGGIKDKAMPLRRFERTRIQPEDEKG